MSVYITTIFGPSPTHLVFRAQRYMLSVAITAYTLSEGKTQHQLAGVVGRSPYNWLHLRLLATDAGQCVAAVTIQVVPFFKVLVFYSCPSSSFVSPDALNKN